MPTCKNCGGEVGEDDVFCVHCGNPVKGKAPEFEEHEKEHSAGSLENESRGNSEENKGKAFEIEEMPEVYKSSSRTLKAKMLIYGIAAVIVIAIILTGFAIFTELSSIPISSVQNCPHECCPLEEDSNFLEKQCLNENAECINNTCVLEECPYECCEGIRYSEESCESSKELCINNTCVKKECPFECCLENSGYEEKSCSGGGSCVNNECILASCPEEYECCIDEIEYEDKECPPGRTCVGNECKITIIEMMKNYISTIISFFKVFL